MKVLLPTEITIADALKRWLLEDIGRGDRATMAVIDPSRKGRGIWRAKQQGIIAGIPIAAQVFQALDPGLAWQARIEEGSWCEIGQEVVEFSGSLNALLTGERVALNLGMWLSGIATLTRRYADQIADLPTRLTDTRKTTPGLRILEKYASSVGGATNHRLGLDDLVMLKDNHIAAAGSISKAVGRVRGYMPYPLAIEVETENLAQVREALNCNVDIIMLDNMPLEIMRQAVDLIREHDRRVKVEASGNITLETIRTVAETGVDYVSTSAPITQATWLDLSMKLVEVHP